MLLSAKTVIRTKNFEVSKAFYGGLLQLTIAENYDDGDGARGTIFTIGDKTSNAFIEISEISTEHDYHRQAFGEPFKSDKADIQILTDDIQYWADRLKNVESIKGPVLRPWGSYYLYLRDPDELQIIIYQEKEN